MVVGCESHAYVMELERDGTAPETLAQIEERGYSLRYEVGYRALHRVGCTFDTKLRLLADLEAM